MEIVERYLQAIQFWLPKHQKQDIISELSDDLHANIQEHESILGRDLTEPEIEEILKQRGSPILVANRYLPQRSLIGPLLFPIYIFVLKIVALCYLVPWLVVWLSLASFSPAFRTAHANFEAFAGLWSSLWLTTFMTLSSVTLVFAILEQIQSKNHFVESWNPRKLPPVRNPNQIARYNSAIEVAVNLFFAVWWARNVSSTVEINVLQVRIDLAPQWIYFYWGFLLSALANTALAAANLAHPYWTRPRAAFRMLCDMLGSVLFCWMFKVHILSAFVAQNLSPQRNAELTDAINMWLDRMFPLAVILCVVIATVNAWRMARIKSSAPSLAR